MYNNHAVIHNILHSSYMERNELMAKQDALEQKRKLNCLILKGNE